MHNTFYIGLKYFILRIYTLKYRLWFYHFQLYSTWCNVTGKTASIFNFTVWFESIQAGRETRWENDELHFAYPEALTELDVDEH